MHVGHTQVEKTCPELTIDGWTENLVKHVKMEGEEPTDTYEGETHLQTSHQKTYLCVCVCLSLLPGGRAKSVHTMRKIPYSYYNSLNEKN